jgi:hypothetical protein
MGNVFTKIKTGVFLRGVITCRQCRWVDAVSLLNSLRKSRRYTTLQEAFILLKCLWRVQMDRNILGRRNKILYFANIREGSCVYLSENKKNRFVFLQFIELLYRLYIHNNSFQVIYLKVCVNKFLVTF